MTDWLLPTILFCNIIGYAVIWTILREIIGTLRQAATGKDCRLHFSNFYYRTGWFAYRYILHCLPNNRRLVRSFQVVFCVLLPMALKLLWILLIVTGFAFFYAALLMAYYQEFAWSYLAESWMTSLKAFFWLMSTDENDYPRRTLIFFNFLVYLQMSVGAAFLLGAAIYLGILSVKRHYLVNTQHGFNLIYREFRSPVCFAAALRRRFGTRRFFALLQHWQTWSEKAYRDLGAYPALKYLGAIETHSSWVETLDNILDVSAAVVIGEDEELHLQAERTFIAARLATIQLARHFNKESQQHFPLSLVRPRGVEDVLSAPLVYDYAESDGISEADGNDVLEAWQTCYKEPVKVLRNHLDSVLSAKHQ